MNCKQPFGMIFPLLTDLVFSAIQDTFSRAFEEWKENYKYLTELVLVLNHKIWQHYETRPEIATLYNTLWAQASQYAMEYLKDDELSYYYDVTD